MREAQRLKALKLEVVSDEKVRKHRKRTKIFKRARVEPGSYAEKLLQAGLNISPEIYCGIVAAVSLGVGYAALNVGVFLCFLAIGATAYYVGWIYLEDRAAKRRKMVIPQLPSFIDGLASALSTGYNIDTAVVQAAESVSEGLLKDELDRVVGALERGLTIDEAFALFKHRIQGKEIVSLAVALSLFHDMGGRMLEPFKRLARKVREQQVVVLRANRDLVQVRQAFYIIFFLSWAAPALLLIVQPDYLDIAFDDSVGRIIIQCAIALQIAALLIFKKITGIKI